MKVYSAADEETLRDRVLVREWAAAGFLNTLQKNSLLEKLKTDLRQTNGFLRAVLFFFTVIVVFAAVGLIHSELRGAMEDVVVCIVSAVACAAIAEVTARSRFYRFGVEEALGVMAVALLGAGIGLIPYFAAEWHSAEIAGLMTACLASLVLYLRFGYFYAALGAVALAAAIPFQFFAWSSDQKRFLSVFILAGILTFTRWRRLSRRSTPAGSAAEAVEAAAWFGIYILVNVHWASSFHSDPVTLIPREVRTAAIVEGWVYYLSWALSWLLPAAGLYLGLRRKDRLVILANLAAALLTLTSNKRYLGWPIHSWDPMILGIFLISFAIGIRRWLQHGPNGMRFGYTANRILQSDDRLMTGVGILSATVHPHMTGHDPGVSSKAGLHEGGGMSGGGGASGDF